MSAQRVRREKAALSSGCKAHPANAPAGSNRSSHGGNEMAEGASVQDRVSTPEQYCIAFRSKDASMMPTRMPSSAGLSGGRQVGVRSSLGVSAMLRRERRLL